jgi:hypothetical protein
MEPTLSGLIAPHSSFAIPEPVNQTSFSVKKLIIELLTLTDSSAIVAVAFLRLVCWHHFFWLPL